MRARTADLYRVKGPWLSTANNLKSVGDCIGNVKIRITQNAPYTMQDVPTCSAPAQVVAMTFRHDWLTELHQGRGRAKLRGVCFARKTADGFRQVDIGLLTLLVMRFF